jgi:hypothetical protein
MAKIIPSVDRATASVCSFPATEWGPFMQKAAIDTAFSFGAEMCLDALQEAARAHFVSTLPKRHSQQTTRQYKDFADQAASEFGRGLQQAIERSRAGPANVDSARGKLQDTLCTLTGMDWAIKNAQSPSDCDALISLLDVVVPALRSQLDSTLTMLSEAAG